MSGVRVGSRLDQLRALERAVRVQIQMEAIRHARGEASDQGFAYPARRAIPEEPSWQGRPTGAAVTVPLAQVNPRVVRDWARANGHEVHPRGPLDDVILGAFVEAHR